MLYYIFFIICLIKIINAVEVKNEHDITTALSEYKNDVTLEVNSQIDIIEDIKINNSIKKLLIIGNSHTSSSLHFEYPLYFDSRIEEIELKNINIIGDLFFKNNRKITLNNVFLNGYIDSDFDETSNEYVKITKFSYRPTGKSVHNCINLSGNVKIDNSSFHGDSSCQNRLIHYNGLESYNFDLKESSFNGGNECSFLSIEYASEANIEYTLFEKGYSSKNIDGGAGMIVTYSNVTVKDSTFNEILSYNNGGAFKFYNAYNVEGLNLNFSNVTSLGTGSIFQISSDIPSKLSFRNIIQKNTGNVKNMRGGGLIMNIEGKAEVDINSYHAENLINNENSGTAFILSDYAQLTINDVYIKKLKGNGGEGGLFFTSNESFKVIFNAYNVTLYDLYQSNKHETSIIHITENNYVIMDGIKLFNSGGYNTNFLNIENTIVSLSNLEVDHFESKTVREFVNYQADQIAGSRVPVNSNIDTKNTINYCKISNIISPGVLFRVQWGPFNILNCEFHKIHECYKYNNCTKIEDNDKKYVKDAELLIAYEQHGSIMFEKTNIDHMYGDIGVLLYVSSTLIRFCNVTNSYFKNGFLHLDGKKNEDGPFSVVSSNFENNTSEIGTIFNLPFFSRGKTATVFISIKDSTFTNNTASKFGGVIFSGENADLINFSNCAFKDNHAKFGDVFYTLSKDIKPTIEYINETEISTVPSTFIMDGNIVDRISILSGESIPEGIMFKLFDDYGHQIYFPEEADNIKFDDLVLFNVETNDTYNAYTVGQTKDYCWGEVCVLPPVKVIGNPGNYILNLKFKSYGMYPKFANDSAGIPIEIRECGGKPYINEAIGNSPLNSCYIPKCEFDCNGGECINNDLCDCKDINLKGKYCNEYTKLERYNLFDMFTFILSSIVILVIIIVTVITICYKNSPVIKGGGFEFLIIILIGLIINTVNAIFLTYEKTTNICYRTYLFSNVGFSFVFGSIFVKSFRVYRIFCRERKSFDIGFKKSTMYLIIASMALFHLIMAIVWFVFKEVKIVNDHTFDGKEFVRCEYPLSKYISSLFNFVILMFEVVLSYSIRKVERKFKESLAIPAYVYTIYILLIYVVGNQNEINVVIKDYFDIVGTIINTIIIVYYLFITKFMEMVKVSKEDKIRTFVKVM